jgi:hypothetical protein
MGLSKVKTLDIAPNIGYFIIDRLAVGLRPGLTLNSSDVPSAKVKSTTYTFAPFIRYYFLKNCDRFNVFADADYGYSKTNYSDPAYFENYESNAYLFAIGPSIFLSENISLEFTVGYKSYKDNYISKRSTTILTQLGFQIHFDPKNAKRPKVKR